ncbi:TPA: hypothetical protein IAC10_11055 [Candidatus Scatousia excrementigallinarum]|uniref:Uncharacterized protein n=1 Tax=Candidatus Scatousia excrementigallinarum TaxID=2840935 RepID=A0A9D1JNL8_9BACT|nr:hypothetical protein [Candidatus Scatousia excrementigallinarum]
MYSFEDYKKDLNVMIDYLKQEIIVRKNNNGYNYQLIENTILPEFENLLNFAEKGYIYTYNGRKELESVRICMWDGFEQEFCNKLINFQEKYSKLNVFSGGKIYKAK